MTKHRSFLPQTGYQAFLAHSGLARDLRIERSSVRASTIFHDSVLPSIHSARANGLGFVIETPTKCAGLDWSARSGLNGEAELAAFNRKVSEVAGVLRAQCETDRTPIVVSGSVGPRTELHDPAKAMCVEEAADYHRWQMSHLAEAGVDMITAVSMTNIEEAVGITIAARRLGMPVVISFAVEADGRLPTGQPLAEAIAEVDYTSNRYPAYFMIDCAKPSYFASILLNGSDWVLRIRGLRAHSQISPDQNDGPVTTLQRDAPLAFAQEMAAIQRALPHITVLGGCCDTEESNCAALVNASTCEQVAA
ncbi:MAG: homocysteine S-methyltransferase family protein [Hyphomicrobiaceae bacterium]